MKRYALLRWAIEQGSDELVDSLYERFQADRVVGAGGPPSTPSRCWRDRGEPGRVVRILRRFDRRRPWLPTYARALTQALGILG